MPNDSVKSVLGNKLRKLVEEDKVYGDRLNEYTGIVNEYNQAIRNIHIKRSEINGAITAIQEMIAEVESQSASEDELLAGTGVMTYGANGPSFSDGKQRELELVESCNGDGTCGCDCSCGDHQ